MFVVGDGFRCEPQILGRPMNHSNATGIIQNRKRKETSNNVSVTHISVGNMRSHSGNQNCIPRSLGNVRKQNGEPLKLQA
jgi:hypothetical protein